MTLQLTVRLALLVLVAAVGACNVEAGPDNPSVGGASGSASSGSNSGGNSTAGTGTAGASGSAMSSEGGASGSATAGTSAGGGGSGTLGSAGLSGMAGGAGSGSGGASGAVPSLGCGMPPGQPLGSWSERSKLSVNNKDRQWWVWLPTGYDPTRAYPVIFTFHGCGGASNFIPMQQKTGSDAIVVRGTGADNGCWTYGAEGDDVKFFDAMLGALQAQYCMDTSRVFAMGYSSGGWMTNTLECSRGDKLRATGTLSGGRAGNGMNCKGKFARATVHDLNDPTNPFDKQGASQELDRVLAQNHCKADVPPIMELPVHASFELLMRRHNRRVFRAARAILKRDDEAEDVMQDAYVRAYEHLGEFRGDAGFGTWVARIAVHEAFARLRRERRFSFSRTAQRGAHQYAARAGSNA